MREFAPAVFRHHRLEQFLQGHAVQRIAGVRTFFGHGGQTAQRFMKTRRSIATIFGGSSRGRMIVGSVVWLVTS